MKDNQHRDPPGRSNNPNTTRDGSTRRRALSPKTTAGLVVLVLAAAMMPASADDLLTEPPMERPDGAIPLAALGWSYGAPQLISYRPVLAMCAPLAGESFALEWVIENQPSPGVAASTLTGATNTYTLRAEIAGYRGDATNGWTLAGTDAQDAQVAIPADEVDGSATGSLVLGTDGWADFERVEATFEVVGALGGEDRNDSAKVRNLVLGACDDRAPTNNAGPSSGPQGYGAQCGGGQQVTVNPPNGPPGRVDYKRLTGTVYTVVYQQAGCALEDIMALAQCAVNNIAGLTSGSGGGPSTLNGNAEWMGGATVQVPCIGVIPTPMIPMAITYGNMSAPFEYDIDVLKACERDDDWLNPEYHYHVRGTARIDPTAYFGNLFGIIDDQVGFNIPAKTFETEKKGHTDAPYECPGNAATASAEVKNEMEEWFEENCCKFVEIAASGRLSYIPMAGGLFLLDFKGTGIGSITYSGPGELWVGNAMPIAGAWKFEATLTDVQVNDIPFPGAVLQVFGDSFALSP